MRLFLPALLIAAASCSGPTQSKPAPPRAQPEPVSDQAPPRPARTEPPRTRLTPPTCHTMLGGRFPGEPLCHRQGARGALIDEVTHHQSGTFAIGGKTLRYDSVRVTSATGTSWYEYRDGGQPVITLRHCNACEQPAFTAMQTHGATGFEADLRRPTP